MHLRVGLSRGGASHGACRNRTFSAQRELARQQFVRSPRIHHQHDQIRRGASDLKANTPAFDAHRGWRGPTRPALVSTGEVSLSILAANDEGAGLKFRHNHDAMGVLQQFLRNTLIRRSHNL
jgi:hypothetical protein